MQHAWQTLNVNIYKILVGKLCGNSPLEKPGRTMERKCSFQAEIPVSPRGLSSFHNTVYTNSSSS
jgi:hypothetical protein